MTAARRTVRAFAAAALAAVLLAAGPSVPLAAAADGPDGTDGTGGTAGTDAPTVIADGHVDLGPRFEQGRWTIGIRDDSGPAPVWRDPDRVVLQAVDAAAVTVPADPAFAFLGTSGTQVWLLPQVQQHGVLWPGWNSQDPSVIHTVDREVTWQLESVRGPGRFTLFLNGSFGTPEQVFDSARPLPQETGIETNSHVHGNWAFTAPGSYLLGIRMTARTLDGQTHDARTVLHFSVGPQDPRSALPAAPDTPAAPTAPTETAAPGAARKPWIPWAVGGGAVIVLAAGAMVVPVRRRVKGTRSD
ncbi:TIGR03773 family transporter-associated surface protein [Kitasatospora fiedleri]|uniref:TIGR03773 family transporter-associated surface protein n=1 Tax=Kitasatospora fiedleri TaxID=2991545 RepID=UPI00249C5ABA|nr:TIGR03773 family transporter-associated surface protein [Kitasatospora fiedleri]